MILAMIEWVEHGIAPKVVRALTLQCRAKC